MDQNEAGSSGKVTFRFTVPNIQELPDKIVSPPTYIHNIPWNIMAMSRPDTTNRTSLGFFLNCNYDDVTSGWSCGAEGVEMRIMSQIPGCRSFQRKFDEHVYTAKENDWGFSNFIEWSKLLDPSNGFVKDDSIILEVKVKADPPIGINWASRLHRPRAGDQNWRVWLKRGVNPNVIKYLEGLEELSGDQQKMLENSEYNDVKISCGGEVMSAQKSILAGRSPVFKAMFQTDMKETRESEVLINDVDPGAVQGMLNWIYTGHMGDGRESFGLDMLKLAHMYELRMLMENCERKLKSQINDENIVNILVVADLVDAKDLKDAAIKFVIGNKSIVQTQEFKEKVNKDLWAEIFMATD